MGPKDTDGFKSSSWTVLEIECMLEEREKDVFKNDCRFEIEQQMDKVAIY